MSAEQSAKEALAVRNKVMMENYDKILRDVEEIQNHILPDYLNATPDAREKNQIFKKWNPMVLDLTNGLAILSQGIEATFKVIKG